MSGHPNVERVRRGRSERVTELAFFAVLTGLVGYGAWSAMAATWPHWWFWPIAVPGTLLTLMLFAYCVHLIRSWRAREAEDSQRLQEALGVDTPTDPA